jgi:uncharacterized protein YqjF (DUF2071 family)
VPVPFHRNFDEVNLRLYVRRGDRRGVTFVREMVPRHAVSAVAREMYNEPYATARMRSRVTGRRYEYAWTLDGREGAVAATATGEPIEDEEGRFITEHSWGYTRQRDGSTVEYQVEHPPWRVWAVTDVTFHGDPGELYGPRFASLRDPVSAFFADGSAVVVGRPRRIRG